MCVVWEMSPLLIRVIYYCCTDSYLEISFLLEFPAGWGVDVTITDTSELTSAWQLSPHTSSVWPWSDVQKVHLYDTFLGSLHQTWLKPTTRLCFLLAQCSRGCTRKLLLECVWPCGPNSAASSTSGSLSRKCITISDFILDMSHFPTSTKLRWILLESGNSTSEYNHSGARLFLSRTRHSGTFRKSSRNPEWE